MKFKIQERTIYEVSAIHNGNAWGIGEYHSQHAAENVVRALEITGKGQDIVRGIFPPGATPHQEDTHGE